ncbi:hypothetical protein [Cellulomonas sp. URHD0024]|uniref:TerD family protein n=1 Tax=Cellulomonas sp. URHD0024 TaxID=1302620 RepID=UPI0006887D66|nr:hypothetical protein [Cellulomonas sp. URHD0024]
MPIDYTKRPAAQPAPEAPTPTVTPAPAPAPGKVTLTTSAPTVSLTKNATAGVLRVNLNWTARPAGAAPARTGFFGRPATAAIDLDLAALFEYTDGSKGVVQALGNAFRDQHGFGGSPIVWLDGDDRSGTNTAGENLFVDLSRVANIRRILVFAFIYEGVPNWAAADAVVTLYPADGSQVEVRLDDHDPRSAMCAIAMLENNGGQLSVRREVRYIRGSQFDVDQAYGWGMRWSAGRK